MSKVRLGRVKASNSTQGLGARRDYAVQLVALKVSHRGHLSDLEVSAVPAVIPKGKGTVQLDKRVPVREGDVCGQPDQVRGVVVEVWRDLDHLREEDPTSQEQHKQTLVGRLGVEVGAGEGPFKHQLGQRQPRSKMADGKQ